MIRFEAVKMDNKRHVSLSAGIHYGGAGQPVFGEHNINRVLAKISAQGLVHQIAIGSADFWRDELLAPENQLQRQFQEFAVVFSSRWKPAAVEYPGTRRQAFRVVADKGLRVGVPVGLNNTH